MYLLRVTIGFSETVRTLPIIWTLGWVLVSDTAITQGNTHLFAFRLPPFITGWQVGAPRFYTFECLGKTEFAFLLALNVRQLVPFCLTSLPTNLYSAIENTVRFTQRSHQRRCRGGMTLYESKSDKNTKAADLCYETISTTVVAIWRTQRH